MKTQLSMIADHIEEPERIELSVNDRSIILIKYLPYISYYDITAKLGLDSTTLSEDDADELTSLQSNFSDPADLPPVKGVIFFSPAMAVAQLFYKYYLDYLSNQGYLVISFDYASIGLSSPEILKDKSLTMNDWVAQLQAATDWTLKNHLNILQSSHIDYTIDDDNYHKYYLCHSLGGQFFGCLNNQNQFEKMIAVTSQNGYWRFYKNPIGYFFFWYFLVPPVTAIMGYFPGKKLGVGDNLPPNIMKAWKRWCTNKNYFFDDDSFDTNHESYQSKLLTIGFTDDPWATNAAIDDLYRHYTQADRESWFMDPQEFGLRSVGHFGYFKPYSYKIWQKTLGWLED